VGEQRHLLAMSDLGRDDVERMLRTARALE
jgi:aspartate carbamoyltransferase catalytic subunit